MLSPYAFGVIPSRTPKAHSPPLLTNHESLVTSHESRITSHRTAVLRLNQIIPHRKPHEIAEALEIHLVHDVIPVAFDGSRRHIQRSRDLLVALSFGQQPHNLDFAWRQRRFGCPILTVTLSIGIGEHEILGH